MKKLMFLISTKGKSNKQICKESSTAMQKYRDIEHIIEEKKNIPEGLKKCEVCGEYNGETKMKNLNWNGFNENISSEEYISVSCLCLGIQCRKCKSNKINRPISNSYNEKDNTVWHHPSFAGMLACSECRKEIN